MLSLIAIILIAAAFEIALAMIVGHAIEWGHP